MTVPGSVSGQAITQVQAGGTLTREQAAAAFGPILAGDFTGADVAWGALFAALHARGATSAEALGLIDAILAFDNELADQLARPVPLDVAEPVVAVTGSGKESFKTFNVSTAAAFVAASHPGVRVIKPAGRATSAVTGASDVLELLGIRLPKTLPQVAELARECGIGVFDYHLVAPKYGPRYEGRFHHLHPLSHVTPWLFIPFRLDGMVFGVSEPRGALAAAVMVEWGVRRAAVVSTTVGEHGRIDEYAPFGTAELTMVAEGKIESSVVRRPVPADVRQVAQQHNHEDNSAMILDLLHGRAPRVAVELTCANAGLLLQVAGVAEDHAGGIAQAEELLASGAALKTLDACREASLRIVG
ncbi:hypothetical protein ACQPXM_40665 [Kribbella sp. CA-253562]|uniref:hypothetical protein n=1 Tax=Kribbella sp. CA-253562 TaxID=3239942 RepID=UPI003D8C0BDD